MPAKMTGTVPPKKLPPNFKGKANPIAKGAKGDNSSKKLPMPSANSIGKGKVKAARVARLTKAGF